MVLGEIELPADERREGPIPRGVDGRQLKFESKELEQTLKGIAGRGREREVVFRL